jgi:excinuclease ABC subunit B
VTGSLERAMAETARRRAKQVAYNEANGITPASIKRSIADILKSAYERDHVLIDVEDPTPIGHNLKAHIADLERRMKDAAANLEFEEAARLRDEIRRLEATELAVASDPLARPDAIEAAVAENAPRSAKGRPGTRTFKGRRRRN